MKNALIVGATGTIGRAIVKKAKEESFNVIGLARKGGKIACCRILPVNVTSDAAIRSVVNKLPSIDLLVFAQGQGPSKNLAQSGRGHILNMLDSHVIGPLMCLKYFRRCFSRDPCIIFISSIAAVKGSYDPAYASAKGALNSLVRSMARELREVARVNAISAGLVEDSPTHKRMSVDFIRRHTDRMYHGQLVDALHVADMVIEIYRNTSVNGAVIAVDGGYLD
jgi:3-oxoacyl-[acyl-carrier protein] reductase